MPKKVTIYDIARELNVSTATVNRALNNKPEISVATRERVLKTAHAMGFTINRAAKSLARPPIRLDFLIYNEVPAFHDEVTRGVNQAFAELSDFNVTGEIHSFSGDPFAAHQQIIDKLGDLANSGHQGVLMITTPDQRDYYERIHELRLKGMNVALINSELLGSERLFSYRQNAVLAGRMAAEILYWLAPTRNVAVFTGQRDILDHANSIGGFLRECAYRNMNVVGVCENYDDPNFAAYNTERMLKSHTEIDGIYINTANSVPVCKKLVEMGLAGKIRIVASDVFPELVQMMRDDVVQATIFQDPFRQGNQATKLLYSFIAEGKALKSEILINPRIVLQSNFAEFENPGDD